MAPAAGVFGGTLLKLRPLCVLRALAGVLLMSRTLLLRALTVCCLRLARYALGACGGALC